METSVIIPAYNQGRYLGAAIRSVLEQTRQDFEIIVVDDGSTDGTYSVAHAFADPRVRYVYQENRGLSAARNTGIRHATGEFLSFLDSDDQFLPRNLELLRDAFEGDPDLGLAAGQAVLIDEQGQPLDKVYDRRPPEKGPEWLLGNPLAVDSILLRRSWIDTVGPFDETLRAYEDWDLWLRLARAGCRMGWVCQPVSLYRFHGQQMTRDAKRMTEANFAVLDKLFADPSLPADWRDMHDLAYSNANLRAASQAYRVGDYDLAKSSLAEAARLNPALLADGADLLTRRIWSWTYSPKIQDPLLLAERIYDHLPEGLQTALQRRRRRPLGDAAIRFAYASYRNDDLKKASQAIRRAIRYQPGLLFNRGTLSVLVHSHLGLLKGYE
jgi:glycosyltransferase involved in cell wall biosynthesis